MKKQIGLFTAILFAVSTLMVGCKAEVHEHTFAEEWSSDETSHWHVATCEHTTEVSEKAAHSFGDWTVTKEATEEAEGSKERVCDVCKYKETAEIAQLKHKHVAGESWKNDDKNHWKECTGCKEQLESAEHEYEWNVTKEATCTEEGTKTGTCKVCKKEVTEKIDVKGHSYSESRSKDASGHWYACVCGAKKDFEEHTYDIGKVVQEATCTKEGKKTVYCTVCEYEKEETIPANGHSCGIWTTTKDPTKTESGQMQSVCKVCGETVTKELQPAPEGFRFVKGGTITGAAYTNNYKGVFIEGRSVTLSDFYMGKYEVTQEEYESVMTGQKVTVEGEEYTLESNPSYCTADSTSYTLFSGDVQEERPVEGVTWYDAVWYCNALSEKEGLDPAYVIEVTTINSSNHITAATVSLVPNANGYRLPTEAEWEYAARGGEPNAADWNYTFSGADTAADASYSSSKNSGLDNVGWYWYNTATGTTGNSPSSGSQGYGTHQVGKKAANALGLYDMSGNVWEWCYDWYGTVNTGTETAPTGAASGSYRVSRGGSWGSSASNASVSYRSSYSPGSSSPSFRSKNLGFRVVRLSN